MKITDDPEYYRGFALGKAAAIEVAEEQGKTLAENNLRDLRRDNSRSPFDEGYTAGYAQGVIEKGGRV